MLSWHRWQAHFLPLSFFGPSLWSTGAARCGLARHWCALFYALPSIHQYQGFWLAVRHVRGDFKDPSAEGEISHFRALATAISGTVGVGNIGGVAVAISLGGAGAAFWLFVAGFLSMSTKLIECTLGVKYRQVHADGSVSGGPMYYLDGYFKERNWPRIGRTLGGIYALALVIGCFGIGNMFQSNQAYQQMLVITGGETSFLADYSLLFGLVLAGIVGLVIIGGITSIAQWLLTSCPSWRASTSLAVSSSSV